MGPLVKMDVALNGNLYGASAGEVTVDTVETVEIDDVEYVLPDGGCCCCWALSFPTSSELWTGLDSTFVANGVRAGFFKLRLGFLLCGLSVFWKVFRTVGDVAERVSNRRLVAFFPNTGATFAVLSVSLGLFASGGAGVDNVGMLAWPKVAGDEGRTASDIVGMGAWRSGNADVGVIRASMFPSLPRNASDVSSADNAKSEESYRVSRDSPEANSS